MPKPKAATTSTMTPSKTPKSKAVLEDGDADAVKSVKSKTPKSKPVEEMDVEEVKPVTAKTPKSKESKTVDEEVKPVSAKTPKSKESKTVDEEVKLNGKTPKSKESKTVDEEVKLNGKTPKSKEPKTPKSKTPQVEEESDVVVASSATPDVHRTPCGTHASSRPPVFSMDNKFLFVCSATNIKMLSVASGQLVRTLHGHTETVTSISLNRRNTMQLISTSMDGTVKFWDTMDGTLLKSIDAGCPVHYAFPLEGLEMILVLFQKKPENSYFKICKVAMQTGHIMNTICKLRSFTAIACSATGSVVAVAFDTFLQVFVLIDNQKHVITENYSAPITCLAINDRHQCLAIGDTIGHIKILMNIFQTNDKQKIVTVDRHWHSKSVRCLTFSADGEYMLSGGREAVLVVWQMSNTQQQFLPRLGAPLQHISVSYDQTLYCVFLADSSLRVVSAAGLQTRQLIKGMKPGNAVGNLTIEPQNGCVLLGTQVGTIQFYQPKLDRFVREVDVLGRNKVFISEKGKPSVMAIDHVAFSDDGVWMATVDRRINQNTPDESFLKFWQLDSASSQYLLHTQISNPHRNGVTALTFRPKSSPPCCVTASLDRRFKVWELVSNLDSKTTDSAWLCQSVGSYREFKCHTALFSPDGSILAVGYGEVITMWDVSTMKLVGSMSHSHPTQPVQKMAFIQNTTFLVTVTPSFLYVWNIATCKVWWSCELTVTALVTDPVLARFAVFTRSPKGQGHLLLFTPDSAVPTLFYSSPENTFFCRSMAFLPTESGASAEFLVSDQHDQLHFVGKRSEVFQEPKPDSQTISNFEKMYSKPKPATQNATLALPAPKQKGNNINPLFDAPSHVIPPLQSLYADFMMGLIQTKKTSSGKNHQQHEGLEAMDLDEPDVSDDETPNTSKEQTTTTPKPQQQQQQPQQKQQQVQEFNNLAAQFDFLTTIFQQANDTESTRKTPGKTKKSK